MKGEIMPTGADLLGEFEEHSPAGVRGLLAAGVSPTKPIKGKRPIDVLIEMYLRSTRFAECLQIMLDAGATSAILFSRRSFLTTTRSFADSFFSKNPSGPASNGLKLSLRRSSGWAMIQPTIGKSSV
jgi:hypothetical protein